MQAYVDESLRQGPEGLYLVAAAVVTSEGIHDARERARGVLLPRQNRFHWRDEDEAQRQKMVAVMLELGVEVYAYASPLTRRVDRARAKCVTRMVWDLGQLGADYLMFESRERHNDQKDRQTILRAQQAGGCPRTLRYEFGRPTEEPLLWLADAAAGAVAAHVATETSQYVDLLGNALGAIVEIGP